MWTFLGRIAELALEAYKTLTDHGVERGAADVLVKKATEVASRAFAAELGHLIALELDAMAAGAERVLEAFTPPAGPPMVDLLPWDQEAEANARKEPT